MKIFFFALLILTGCATRSPETNALLKDQKGLSKTYLEDVPFEDQDDYLCAPASLSMVLRSKGKTSSRDELRSHLVTEKVQGTFQSNLISEVRYQGMMGIPLYGMEALLTEVRNGNPVIVLQNLGLDIAPVWHYAVVTGFNLKRKRPVIRLHSGHEENKKMNMKLFEETWAMGDSWGLLVLNPGEMSLTQDELSHVRAAAGLEQVNKLEAAELAYQSILKRWPQSLAALIGMGNITFTKQKYKSSLTYLEKAVSAHPDSPMAWHNLATLEGALGRQGKAHQSAKKAMELVDAGEAATYRQSLQRWLR